MMDKLFHRMVAAAIIARPFSKDHGFDPAQEITLTGVLVGNQVAIGRLGDEVVINRRP